MKKFAVAGLLGAVVFGGSLNVYACGPYFQPSYMEQETPYTVVLKHDAALRRMVKNMSDLIPDFPEFNSGIETNEAVKKDFTEAVNKRLTRLSAAERNALIKRYITFVTKARKDRESVHFPFELPTELSEFYLYRKGVAELADAARKNDGIPCKEMPPSWKKLLELPKEQRHYRTAWVYFMLGNANNFQPSGFDYHKKCVKAVQEDFADTAGLAQHSYIRGNLWSDEVLKLKWTLYNIKKYSNYNSGLSKRQFNILQDDVIEKMMQDPLCREILIIFDCENDYFRKNMDKYKYRNIDIQAFYAYNKGELDKAKKYISLLEKPTLLSLWIEAKIARHDGKNDIAIEKLRHWLKMAEKIKPGEHILDRIDDSYKKAEPDDIALDIYGLLGNALVTKGDFIEAAKFFVKADQYENEVNYIIDRFLSLDDLIVLAKDVPSVSDAVYKQAIREGKFDIARKYLLPELKIPFERYVKFIADGNNKKLSNDEQALALYNAAKIMRHYGMELCGSFSDPDNARFNGNYCNHNLWGWTPYAGISCKCKYSDRSGYWKLCKKHAANFKADKLPGLQAEIDFTKVPQHLRYHYRYRAAKLLLRASVLAEDQDLKAMINLFGGYCMNRSAQEADVFYKNLVWGSWKTPVAQEADSIRWFPKNKILTAEMESAEPCPSVKKIKQMMNQIYGKELYIAKLPHCLRKFFTRKWDKKIDDIDTNILKYLKKRAETADDMTAWYLLGLHYEQGRGCQKDIPQALYCFRCANVSNKAVQKLNKYKIANVAEQVKGVKFTFKPYVAEVGREVYPEMIFTKNGKTLLHIKSKAGRLCFMKELYVLKNANRIRFNYDESDLTMKSFDYRTMLHDLSGKGDFRYLIIADYHTGTSPKGNYTYIVDVKDNFKLIAELAGGETIDLPYMMKNLFK